MTEALQSPISLKKTVVGQFVTNLRHHLNNLKLQPSRRHTHKTLHRCNGILLINTATGISYSSDSIWFEENVHQKILRCKTTAWTSTFTGDAQYLQYLPHSRCVFGVGSVKLPCESLQCTFEEVGLTVDQLQIQYCSCMRGQRRACRITCCRMWWKHKLCWRLLNNALLSAV